VWIFADFAFFKISNIQVIMPPKSKTKKRFQQLKALRISQNSDIIRVDKDVSFWQQYQSGKKGNGPNVWLCGAHEWVSQGGFHAQNSFIPNV